MSLLKKTMTLLLCLSMVLATVTGCSKERISTGNESATEQTTTTEKKMMRIRTVKKESYRRNHLLALQPR